MTRMKARPDPPPTKILERIRSHLATLKLATMEAKLDEELSALDQGRIAPSEAILRLLQAEVEARQERRIERRIRQSKLPERRTLAELDFSFQPDLDKALVMELASMGFVSRRQGVILAGSSGTGKSHIAKALALEGCKQLFWVRYTTAAEMLAELYAALADGSLDTRLKHYSNPDLLVVDEVGFDRLEQADARNAALFFKVIDGRYTKRSTILTTNIDFEQLGTYLGDPIITTAIVDRLIHHSTVITIDGPSWRHKESRELNSSMRKRPERGEKIQKTPAKKTTT